ncbi:galactokinase [Bacteroidota bacterium]
MLNNLKSNFLKLYGQSNEDIHHYFAPGRVNLIGEHTDYNNGYVLPCALSFGTYLAIRKSNNKRVKLASENFEFKADIPGEKLSKKIGEEWVNYPLGVIEMMKEKGLEIDSGLELLYSGNIPNGAGLSSSASIELLTAFALNTLFELNLKRLDLIMVGKKAENEFVGVNCGIMDQFIVGKARKKSALFLNCGTLKYVHVPFVLNDHQLVVINTNKKRKLSDSKYNERVKECQQAAEEFRSLRALRSLSEISIEAFNVQSSVIKDEVVRKRAHHVISENKRVMEAVKALWGKNIDRFGELMYESHISLRDDYEVTGIELDTLVDLAMNFEGTIGSRMTGAGFGGCTVSIIKKGMHKDFEKAISSKYTKITGLIPEFYYPEIDAGVRQIS